MCQNLRVRFGKLLSLFSAFSVGLLVMQLFLQARPVRVSADSGDSSSITLTPAQTVALLGSTIEGTYYNASTRNYETVYLHYVHNSSSYVPSDHSGNIYSYSQAIFPSDFPLSDFPDTMYLIYQLSPYSDSVDAFSSWNSSYTYGEFNFSCRFAIEIPSLTSFEFSVIWPVLNPGYYSPSSGSSLVFNTSFNSAYTKYGFVDRNTSRLYNFSIPMFFEPENTTAQNIPEQYRANCGLLYGNPSNDGESFSMYSVQLGLSNLYGWTKKSDDGLYAGLINYGDPCPFILIECPKLTGYTPPVVTTTTVQTTNPYNYSTVIGYTHQTVDLSNLESGVAAIVQQEQYNGDTLDWIGNNTMITANNLAYIANKLDQIYELMVERGEIAVNLVPADPLRALDTNVHNQIHDNLSSFTTAQIPNDVANGFSFYNDLFSRFTTGDLAFFGWLGIFSLVTLTLGWFLFKGRG